MSKENDNAQDATHSPLFPPPVESAPPSPTSLTKQGLPRKPRTPKPKGSGVSREAVRQTEQAALRKLRWIMRDRGLSRDDFI